MLGNPVLIMVVIRRGIQVPQIRYLVTSELFRGLQEMDVEMADGTEDILETCALLEQQLEVTPDTPNMI